MSRHIDAETGEIVSPLSDPERADFVRHEIVIERGHATFVEVGVALLDIRDRRLYRTDWPTFEAYCRERWQLGRSSAYQIIDSAAAVVHLSAVADTRPPTNEAQARALAALTPDEQHIVWQVVTETAPGGRVTAAHVKSVVSVLREIQQTGAIDDGEGEAIPLSAASTDHLKAAVTEETYERMQRQAAHIAAAGERMRLTFDGFRVSDLPYRARQEMIRQGLDSRPFRMVLIFEGGAP